MVYELYARYVPSRRSSITAYPNLVFLSVLLLTACTDVDVSMNSLGRPTEIPDGSTAIESICRLQREFRDLTKPVLVARNIQPEDSRRMTVGPFESKTEKLPTYYQFLITPEAEAWRRSHTPAELSVALNPLVFDPEIGGEAAVLLASLASSRTFRTDQYGYHQSQIAAGVTLFLYETGYRSTSDRGSWGAASASKFRVPRQLLIAFQRGASNTLNAKIAEIWDVLHYYENGLVTQYIYGKDPFEEVSTLDEWIPVNGLPDPPDPERHVALERWSTQMLVLASYPVGVPRGITVYRMGFERYWPLVYSYQHTVKEVYYLRSLPKMDVYLDRREGEIRDYYVSLQGQICNKNRATD